MGCLEAQPQGGCTGTSPWKEGLEMGKLGNIQGKAAKCLHLISVLQKMNKNAAHKCQLKSGLRNSLNAGK